MVGFGEQYIIPYALRLGASSAQVGILSAVPAFLGSWSQIISAELVSRVHSRKKLVATFAFIQGAMLVPLFILPLITENILFLIMAFSAYAIAGNMAAPGWSSLIADVVQPKERTTYFAKRNKAMLLTLVISLITAGIIMHSLENVNIWIAFWVLFTIAFFSKTTSVVLLLKYHEPENLTSHNPRENFFDFVTQIRKTNFGKFVIFKSALEFSVMLGGPFLSVYWLEHLQFSYVEYSILILSGLLAKAISAPYWGNYAKSYGTRNMMFVSAILISILPMNWFLAGYFFEGTPFILWAFVLTEILTGFSWAGMELTTFTNTLENSEHRNVAKRMAYFTAILGTFVLIGGLAGAGIISQLESAEINKNVFRVMFILSFAARLTTTLIFMGGVKEIVVKKKIDERQLLLDFVLIHPLVGTLSSTRYRFDSFIEKNDRCLNKDCGLHSQIEDMQRKTLASFSGKKNRKTRKRKGKPYKRLNRKKSKITAKKRSFKRK